MKYSASIAILAIALASPSQAQEKDLNLICTGGGSANKFTSGSINAWDNNGNYGSATVTGRRSQGFADQVSIRLTKSDPRIRMPRTMLPNIRGGDDGWFKLKDIKFNGGEITASAAVNIINNPKIRIDRYTGAISISGKAGDFTGQCQAYDPAQTERAF